MKFIIAFCDALELRDPIFMGSSFGGNVALQLALHHPDRFRAVIPVEAADYAPGFFLDWWRHPHANAAQVCGIGRVGSDGAAKPRHGPLADLALLHPGVRDVQRRSVFLFGRSRPAGQAGRHRYRALPGDHDDRHLRLPDAPEATEETAARSPAASISRWRISAISRCRKTIRCSAVYLKEALRLIDERT